MSSFEKVKSYLLELEYNIVDEIESEGIVIIEKENAGISRLICDCEDPILIIECPLFQINNPTVELLTELLGKNRDMVHGAFALTETNLLIYRDTLQLENLDLNELEGTLDSFELLLAEYASRLIEISKI